MYSEVMETIRLILLISGFNCMINLLFTSCKNSGMIKIQLHH